MWMKDERPARHDADMLLQRETTPGYANLHRRQQRRRHVTIRAASVAFGLVVLLAIAAVVLTRPDSTTLLGLGGALLLYVMTSFAFERPPDRPAPRPRRAVQRHR